MAVITLAVFGCGGKGESTPEKVGEKYVSALKKGDPEAIFKLSSDDKTLNEYKNAKPEERKMLDGFYEEAKKTLSQQKIEIKRIEDSTNSDTLVTIQIYDGHTIQAKKVDGKWYLAD